MNEHQNQTQAELFLILVSGKLAVWVRTGAEHQDYSLPLNGDEWRAAGDTESLRALIQDTFDYLDDAELVVHLLYDKQADGLLSEFAYWSGPKRWRWQWLHWERYTQNLQGAFLTELIPLSAIVNEVLPKVWQAHADGDGDGDADCAVAVSKNAEVSVKALDAVVPPLPSPIPLLVVEPVPLVAAQVSVCPPLDGEQMLVFLPALYIQAFSVLSGVDLAMLIGRVEPFHTPSPYPEPCEDVLRKRQREFRALPLIQQKQILDLTREVNHRLRVRPEMQAYIWDVEVRA